MTVIKAECTENAIGMLRCRATVLNVWGKTTHYVLDGKVWVVSWGTVFRSDDDEESQKIIRHFNRNRTSA